MACCSKFMEIMAHKGGLLATGVACITLTESGIINTDIGRPIAYCLTALGIVGVLAKFIRFPKCVRPDAGAAERAEVDDISEIGEDSGYEERMAEFRRLKPSLERFIKGETRIFNDTKLFLDYRNITERWSEDNKNFDHRLAAVGATRHMPASSSTANSGNVVRREFSQLHEPSTSKTIIVYVEHENIDFQDSTTQVATDGDISVVDDESVQMQPSTANAANVGDVIKGERTPLPQSSGKSSEVDVLQRELRQECRIEVDDAEDTVLGLQQGQMPGTNQTGVKPIDEDSTDTECSEETSDAINTVSVWI